MMNIKKTSLLLAALFLLNVFFLPSTACEVPETPENTVVKNIYVSFEEDFSDISDWVSPAYNVDASVGSDGICTLTRVDRDPVDPSQPISSSNPINTAWGKIERTQTALIPVDLSKSPILRISLPEDGVSSEVTWKIGLYKTSPAWEYFELQGNSKLTGTFDYDVPKITGWNGKEKLQVALVAEGLAGQTVKFDYLQFGSYAPPVQSELKYELFANINGSQPDPNVNAYMFTVNGSKVYEDNLSEPYIWSTFEWSFSDGGTGCGNNVVHLFDGAGPYRATVTVTDVFGNKEFASTEVGGTKYMYADYFVGYRSREYSGRSDLWWNYNTENAPWAARPGDLYQPGSDVKKQAICFNNPLVGYYDQWDPTAIEYSILLSKMLGIDGFAFEYQDKDCVADSLMQKFLPYARKYGFKMTAQWIPSTMYGNFKDKVTTRTEMKQMGQDVVSKVTADYIMPTDATYNGKPLWFVYDWDRRDTAQDNDLPYTQTYNFGYTAEEMGAMRSTAAGEAGGKDPVFMACAWSFWPERWNSASGEHFPREDVFDGLYGWLKPDFNPMPYDPNSEYYRTHGYLGENIDKIGTIADNLTYLGRESTEQDYQIAQGNFSVKGGTAFAGFDDAYNGAWGTGFRRYIPYSDENGNCLDQTLSNLNSGTRSADIGLFATFADWAEGTTVEPTQELQYEVAKKAAIGIAAWKGMQVPSYAFLDSYLPFIVDIYNFRAKYNYFIKAGYSEIDLKDYKEAVDAVIPPLLDKNVTAAQEKRDAAQIIMNNLNAGLVKQDITLEWADESLGADYDANAVKMQEDTDVKGQFYFPDSVRNLLSSGTYQGNVSFEYKDEGTSWLNGKVNSKADFAQDTEQYCDIIKVRKNDTGSWISSKADFTAASFDEQFMDRPDFTLESQGGMAYVNDFTHTANSLTVSFWVKNDLMASKTNNYINIVNSENGDAIFALKANNDPLPGKLEGVINLSGTLKSIITDGQVLNTCNWTHIAATWDGSTGNFILYVNGQSVKTVDNLSGVLPPNADRLLISGVKSGMDGKFDELRVYNRALGDAEIAGLFTSPSSPVSDGLEGSWSFEEGIGANVSDSGPDPKHPACLYNGGAWSTSVPFAAGNTHSASFISDHAGPQLRKVKIELESAVLAAADTTDFTACFEQNFNEPFDFSNWNTPESDVNDPNIGGTLTQVNIPPSGNGGMLRIAAGKQYAKTERKDTGYIKVDLDKNPVLRLNIAELGGSTMTKVIAYNISDNWSSKMIKGLTDDTGILDYDISSITGWTGQVTLQLVVIADCSHVVQEGENQYATFDYILMGRKNDMPISEYGFVDNFSELSGWNGYQADLSSDGQTVTLNVKTTCPAPTWGKMERNNPDGLITIDLDKHPILKTRILSTTGTWKLYLMDTSNWNSYLIQGNTCRTGTFEYDIPFITGLTGQKTLQVQYVIEGAGASLTVDDLRFRKLEYSKGWYIGFEDHFTNDSEADWNIGPDGAPGSKTIENNTVLKLQAGSEQWGKLERPSPGKLITVNLDVFPILRVTAPETQGPWKILAYNALNCNDVRVIKPCTDETGILDYNLRDITGWTGETTLQFQIITEYSTTNYIKIDDLQLRKPDYSYALPEGVGFDEKFDSSGDWIPDSNIELSAPIKGQVRAKVINTPAGCVNRDLTTKQRSICVNLDRYPVLSINVPSLSNPAGSTWGFGIWRKVPDSGWTEYKVIKGQTNETGTLDFHIPNLTGWSGDTQMNIQIWVEGGINDYVDLDRLQFIRSSSNILPQGVGFNEDFSDISDWNNIRGTICSNGCTATITTAVTGTPGIDLQNWAETDRLQAGRDITVDLDRFRYLKLNATALDCNAKWKLVAGRNYIDQTGKLVYEEKVIQSYTTEKGLRYYDMWSGTPSWKGVKRMILKFYLESTDGTCPTAKKCLKLDYLQFVMNTGY